MAESINLLGSLSRVEIPFIKVVIGNYVFGVYDKETVKLSDINLKESFTQHNITYPNYIQSLDITKIIPSSRVDAMMIMTLSGRFPNLKKPFLFILLSKLILNISKSLCDFETITPLYVVNSFWWPAV